MVEYMLQVHVMHRCGRPHLRLVANAWGFLTSNRAQSLPMTVIGVNRADTSRPMAASPLQLDLGLIRTALTTGLPRIPALQRKEELEPETGRFDALRHLPFKEWCARSQASSGEEGMSPEELQQFLWKQFFSHPTQWWDNRRSKRTPRHPDFRHKMSKVALWLNNRHKPAWVDLQLTTWDAGINRPPESVSMSVQGQGGLGTLGAHEGHLEVGMCRKLCEDGQITDAVEALNRLVQRGCHVDKNLFYRVLKKCIADKDLVLGRRIHALTAKSGYEGDAFLATHLIGLYASHGRLEEAMRVFTKVSVPTAYNWATIIFAYARHGEAAQAIALYRQIRESTVKPDNHIYLAVIKACAITGDLVASKEVHAHILESPGKPDIFVQTGLVDMYAKCGRLEDARRLFDRLPQRGLVTWNAMITGYAQQGMGQDAISLFIMMQEEGLTQPNSVTFICLLQACARVGVGGLHHGKQFHTEIEERGLQYDGDIGGSLVNMYAKCGSLDDARRVFDRLPDKNVVTWTAMIAGYARQGMGQEALCLYNSMQQDGLTPPDSVAFVCLLQACASVGVGALHQGKQLHARIEEKGLQDDVVLGGSIVNMYAKCGSLQDARRVFDRLPERNVVTWNVMIAAYAQEGMAQEALCLYNSMQQEGLSPPDSSTFTCLLQACASAEALPVGKQLHAQIQERGLQADVVLGGSLVKMYAKCGSLEDARNIFDGLPDRSLVSWNAMLAGYTQLGMSQEALTLYSNMQQEGVTPPDSFTFSSLLQACANVGIGALHQGKQLHAQIEERGLQAHVVLGTCLIDMYAKCCSLEDARKIFDSLTDRDVVTWNAMLAGYAQHGMAQEALSLFCGMQKEGVTPNSVTFVCLLQACAVVAALPLGKQLHAQIEERGLQTDGVVGAALVNMYAKCGSMFDSQQVFDSLPERSVEVWNALTGGYTRLGDSKVVFDLLDRMRLEGIQPDGITFLSVLTVCSHVGLVDKGRNYFEAMRTDYGISPTVEHYACMMDLLGRAGHLDKALEMAKTMPFPPNAVVWLTLLGACRKWINVEIGQQAFEFAVSVDEKAAASYVLMSNIYASAEMWEEAKEMQVRRVKCGAWKKPGQSWWTDMDGVVHTFVVGDNKRPDREALCIQGCNG